MVEFKTRNQSKKRYFIVGLFSGASLVLVSIVLVLYFINNGYQLQTKVVNNGHNKTWSELNGTDLLDEAEVLQLNSERLAPNDFRKDSLSVRPDFDQDRLTVATKLGKVTGFRRQIFGSELYTFLGLPYAEPPVGQLRFRRTVPLAKWNQVIDGTRWPKHCVQAITTQTLYPVKILHNDTSEDCLYLNIWTPVVERGSNLPVLVFIHGGSFAKGSPMIDEYDGRVMATVGRSVVVSVAFRLGMFGFLDLGVDSVSGNMAFYDIAVALQFVRDNIESFGGNPFAVTLFGQSAGAATVGLMMMSPVSSHLFDRAILQSGAPMVLNMVYGRANEVADDIARLSNCSRRGVTQKNAEMVAQCLRQLPTEVLVGISKYMLDINDFTFTPTIPSPFLPELPSESLPYDVSDSVDIFQKEVMFGVTAEEGTLFLHNTFPETFTRHKIPNITTLVEAQELMTTNKMTEVIPEDRRRQFVNTFLTGEEVDTPFNFAKRMAAMLANFLFTCPAMTFADKLTRLNVSVYMYHFNERASSSSWGGWMGVTHHDEIQYVFGIPLR